MAETRKAGRSRRQDERREKILQAATEVFFKSGFAGASIDEVIAKVGGSKRTIYDYFGNKEALFAAIVKEVPARALPPLAVEEISTQDLETMLHEVGRRYLDVIMSPPALALYRTMVAEGLRFPELAKAFFESGPGRASASLGAALKQRRAVWRIAVDDCDRAAEQFLGMIRDDLHLRVVLGLRKPPGPKEAERTVAQAVAIFVRGCRLAERPAGRSRNRSPSA
jgi:TetR/AcrR family transcriptional repressor of mexJK operon